MKNFIFCAIKNLRASLKTTLINNEQMNLLNKK